MELYWQGLSWQRGSVDWLHDVMEARVCSGCRIIPSGAVGSRGKIAVLFCNVASNWFEVFSIYISFCHSLMSYFENYAELMANGIPDRNLFFRSAEILIPNPDM